MGNWRRCAQLFLVFYVLAPSAELRLARAEEDSAAAAIVAGEPILIREIERELAIVYGDRAITAAARESLRAKTLEQLVKRRLILYWLGETKQAPGTEEIERALSQLQQKLTERGRTLSTYLREQQLDEPELRRSLAWQIGWQRYLDKQLTDKNLERYFEQHRREFDGTRIRVAHILFKVDDWEMADKVETVRGRALHLLTQIREGATSFSEAARTNSEGPSRDKGGDIGWIGRHEPMPESFSRAAFALEPMQVSDPVASPFGYHLIQCLELKPGEKQWGDVRGELEKAVTVYLFDWAADQAKAKVAVEYLNGFRSPQLGTEPLPGSSK